MEMTLQNIYFIVGVVGFSLAAICAVAAIAYFLRADIRGVLADLSGKTRQAELAEFSMSKGARSAKKNVLTSNDEWQGRISHGDLAASSGSDAITDEQSPSGSSGSGSDWSFSDSPEDAAAAEADAGERDAGKSPVAAAPAVENGEWDDADSETDIAETEVDARSRARSKRSRKRSAAGADSGSPVVSVSASAPDAAPSPVSASSASGDVDGAFRIVQQIVLVHAHSVVGEQGVEVPVIAASEEGAGQRE